ncbi:hypothetical protein F4821DRAFT_87047 [Hypoxylon rubiginosum]|uniref:Uncharacterized protein n=1 Tax=Hypoxylon rubiginosum TaxID=110542 RepID=A0ACC0D7Y2_9PEZI|nr:hypothetical protein F4821DRAFT_87047 [Hypoxylon rubiginosum]
MDPINFTPPGSSFTPINGRASLKPDQTISSGDEQKPDVFSEVISLDDRSQNPKRGRTVYEEEDVRQSKRQVYLPATPSFSPFQTLRVTKSSSVSSQIPYSKIEDVPNSDDGFRPRSTGPHPPGRTTMEQLTPYPTRELHESRPELTLDINVESVNGIHAEAIPSSAQPPNWTPYTLPSSDDQRIRGDADRRYADMAMLVSQDAKATSDPNDEYPLGDDIMDEDMTSLLGSALDHVQETQVPPSSVTQGWDHDSRSAAEYDSTLQYSSPSNSGAIAKLEVGQDDLLDDDVDWNMVHALVDQIPKGVSTVGSQITPRPSPIDHIPCTKTPIQQNSSTEEDIPLKPFSRPSFPEKVRDRSVVPGLSSDAILRTCFRIGEMINQAVRCMTHQQEVVFELFARVTYSSRESLTRRQHFQFVDLFKDQQPYPGGTLTNWRAGSQIDRQSETFLDKGARRKLCRCLCKPKRDRTTEVGFTLIVLSIREADWTQVEWAKKVVCGDSDEQHDGPAVGVNI